MSTLKDVVLGQFQTSALLIDMFTKDLSDAEYFVPAIEGANHTAWVLGHLACSEDSAVATLTGKPKRITGATEELFNGKSKCLADASAYPSRKELDDMFRNSRAHTTEALQMFDESQWDDPSPGDLPKDFFPTKGSLWAMQGAHSFWHIGQITTCRVALKKKPALS